MPNELRESFANLVHEQWAHWMKHLFSRGHLTEDGSFLIYSESVDRWMRQMATPYAFLSESEQDSDRNEADKFLALLEA